MEDEARETNSGIETQSNGIENRSSGIENQSSGIENQSNGIEKTPQIDIKQQQERILFCLGEAPKLSAKELASDLGLSERTLMRRLAELQNSGRLRRIGPDKGGHWEVLEEK